MNDLNAPAASLLKRLLAIIYDSLLLLAWLLVAEIFPVVLNHGQAISHDNGLLVFYVVHPLYLLSVSFLFFGWFWTHGGQTLGMKTWKLKLLSLNTESVSWQQAAIRFVMALVSWSCLGLGFIVSLFNPDQRSWHDSVSHTRIIKLPSSH